jgi:VWFA-related protein
MRRTYFLVAVLATALGLTSHAQQGTQTPPPATPQQPSLTFRAAANYVEVDVIITDNTGAFVRDLKTTDFEVAEDSKLQNLTICSLVDIPIVRPDPLLFRASVIEPDVMTNEKEFDGRVYMIVLDGFHVGTARSTLVQKQVTLFLERFLGANDLAAIIHIGNPSAGQEFTSNRRLLLASARRFTGQGLHSATENIIRDALLKQDQATTGFDPGPPEDTERHERAYMARESLESVKRLSEYMSSLTGRRKALLFFSEGIDYETQDPPTTERAGGILLVSDASAVRSAEMDMIAAATRANVSVYSIDPRGLSTGTEDAILIGVMPPPTSIDGTPTQYGAVGQSMISSLSDESKRARESLRMFSDNTGGRAIVDRNDMDAAFRRVVEDNSSYYILGYDSPNTQRDGKFHRVTVKVKRPGLQVRTRNGYYAPSDRTSKSTTSTDRVGTMLGSPAPLSGLGMRANAGVLKGLAGKARIHLTVEFNGNDVVLQPQNNLWVNDIEVGYHAVDMKGQPQASGRHVIHLKFKPLTRDNFGRDGVRYVTEFDVPPGRYQLRIAGREQATGRTGSIFYDVDVPDFTKLPLAMSDILITSTVADRTLTGKGPSSFGNKLPGQTTTTRSFSSNDTLTLFAGIYDADTTHVHSVDVKMTVRSDDGTQVFAREDVRESRELSGNEGQFPYTVSVPLRGLKAGRYVLAVEARSRLRDEPVTREIEFTIK